MAIRKIGQSVYIMPDSVKFNICAFDSKTVWLACAWHTDHNPVFESGKWPLLEELSTKSHLQLKLFNVIKIDPRLENESGRRGPAWALFACAWCVESRSVFGFGPGLVGVEIFESLVLRFKNFDFYAGPCVIPFFPIIGQNSRLSEHWGKREKSHGYTKGMVLLRFEF